MKILNKILLVVIAGLMVTCDDLVEIDQPGRLSPEATFESVSDLESGLLGVYAELDVSSEVQFNSTFTDEISIGFDNGGQGLGTEYNFIQNPTSDAPFALWTKYYDAINAATRIIDAAPLVEVGATETDAYNSIVGEAHAIRAFSHFTLLAYFSEDITDDNSLGVILVDEIPNVEDALPRSTTGDVFTLIESDLAEAESSIPASASEVTRITQHGVTALKARIAAYRQNYTLAEQYSQEILDDFDLADSTEYASMYRLDTPGEVIFKLERTIGDPYSGQGETGSPLAGGWVGANYAFVGPDIDGSPYFEMGRSLYNLLDTNDVRYEINVSSVSEFAADYPNSDPETFVANDVIPIDKYRGNVPGEGQPLMNDIKVFRVSEMLLINAEAKVANGDLPGAAQLIKDLRDARFSTPQPLPSYASEQEAYADILQERRVELAFEGHRFMDLKRLGERANQGIDRDPLDCERYGACDGPEPGNDHRYVFPIPLVEIDGNNTIADQQNPGY